MKGSNWLEQSKAQKIPMPVVLGVLIAAMFYSPIQATSEPAKESNSYLKNCPVANGFVFPIGPPDAKDYYNAQPFGKNNHLGDDWNGTGGGNTDLGDPIYAIASGVVSSAKGAGPGWGNVVRIYHNIGTQAAPRYIESLYAHLKTIEVAEGEVVSKSQRIGTMGNANGRYYAHLHLEVRTHIDMPIGGGYSKKVEGFIDPAKFIKAQRGAK